VKRATAAAANKKGRKRGQSRKNMSPYNKFVKTGFGEGMTKKEIGAAWTAKKAQNPRKRGGKGKGKRNTWPGHPAAHGTASKKGWGKRKRGSPGYKKPAFPATGAANKKKGRKRGNPKKFSLKMFAHPIKSLGSFIVPMRKAGAIADIKAHPVPHVIGGLGGFTVSARQRSTRRSVRASHADGAGAAG
jgi:hypothetical protein